MSEEKTVINYSVKVETRARIEMLGEQTNRKPGNVLDWLVADAWKRINAVPVTSDTQPCKDPDEIRAA
jgi:hypothetical protein